MLIVLFVKSLKRSRGKTVGKLESIDYGSNISTNKRVLNSSFDDGLKGSQVKLSKIKKVKVKSVFYL